MRNLMQKTALALGFAGALAIGATGASRAAPLPTGTLAVKAANPSTLTDVHWRGGGGALAFGIGAGLLGAAALGAWGPYPYYGYYGYPYPDYRPYAYYGAPYPYWRGPHWRHRYVRHYRRW